MMGQVGAGSGVLLAEEVDSRWAGQASGTLRSSVSVRCRRWADFQECHVSAEGPVLLERILNKTHQSSSLAIGQSSLTMPLSPGDRASKRQGRNLSLASRVGRALL